MSYMRGRVLKRIDHLDPTSYVYDLLLLCAYKYIGPAPWVINMVINDHGDRWTFCPRRQRPGSGAGQRGAGTNSDPPLPQWCSAVLVGARDSPPQGMQRGSNPPPTRARSVPLRLLDMSGDVHPRRPPPPPHPRQPPTTFPSPLVSLPKGLRHTSVSRQTQSATATLHRSIHMLAASMSRLTCEQNHQDDHSPTRHPLR